MQFNIIKITEEELKKLSVAKMRLLRTAQQKKDELEHNAEKEFIAFCEKAYSAGMNNSTLIEDKKAEIYKEVDYRIAILADNLVYSMGLLDDPDGDDSKVEYLVDYSLSYNERYIIVRDYYLKFKDKEERMAKYSKDEVAKKYLGTYYGTLYNVLATYDK